MISSPTLSRLALAAGALVLASPSLLAQADGSQTPVFTPQVPAGSSLEFPNAPAAANDMVRTGADELLTVKFEEVEIRDIIAGVAELNQLNVVIPETLTGTATINLRNVTWEQVFEVVLQPVGFAHQIDRNIIKIRPLADFDIEPSQTRVFQINFSEAQQLQATISPLIDAGTGGRIQVDQRSNTLIITERPTKLNNIAAIIDRLDKPNQQVMIESKFVELTSRDSKNVGVNWASLNGMNFSAGPFERQYDRGRDQTRTDGVTASNNTGTTTNSTTTVGGTGTGVPTSTSTVNLTDTLNRTASLLNNATEGRVDQAIFNADALRVIVSALSTVSGVQLISNPTVVTMNNTPARINIGEEFPIPKYQYNSERGVFEVNGFDYKPIGIILNVTPQVNNAGFINLNLRPEISSRTGVVNFGGSGGGSGAEIPIITTRATESTVMLKDGFTLAIGGLMETTTGKTETKVPLLGDLPLVGRAFRSKSDSEDRRSLVIFITAKTLNPDGSTYLDVFNVRELWQMGVRETDVPTNNLSEEDRQFYERLRTQRDNLENLSERLRLQRQSEGFQRAEDALNKGAHPNRNRRMDNN